MHIIYGSDAANPDGPLPGQVACGYIGGNAAHVWTREQWEMQTAEFLLPCWAANVGDHPAAAGTECVVALKDLGVPGDCAYMLDCEADSGVDPSWINEFARMTARYHYGCYVYSSADHVFTLPPRSGYIVADWDGVPAMYEHPHAKGKQYQSGVDYDLDVFDPSIRFWRNPNRDK